MLYMLDIKGAQQMELGHYNWKYEALAAAKSFNAVHAAWGTGNTASVTVKGSWFVVVAAKPLTR